MGGILLIRNYTNNYLSTTTQRFNTWPIQLKKYWRRPKLKGCPQRRGLVLRLRLCTPRKPNSARRPVAKVYLNTKKRTLAHIPGYNHSLRRHSRTLVCGVGARDLPYVSYTCIRGVYDFTPLFSKTRRRSVYAVPMPSELKTHVRRKFREFMDS